MSRSVDPSIEEPFKHFQCFNRFVRRYHMTSPFDRHIRNPFKVFDKSSDLLLSRLILDELVALLSWLLRRDYETGFVYSSVMTPGIVRTLTTTSHGRFELFCGAFRSLTNHWSPKKLQAKSKSPLYTKMRIFFSSSLW